MKKDSVTERLYNRFEYLAEIYAGKLFGYDVSGIGLEKEDIVQECRIKIYTSIIAYGKKWKKYKETGRYKPVPMLPYLQYCLNNKIKDLIKQVNKGKSRTGNEESIHFLSLEDFSFDIGRNPHSDTTIDFEKVNLIVNGVDILEGLNSREKTAFMMYLKGFPINHISKIFKRVRVNAEELIRRQSVFIRSKKNELFDHDSTTYYTYSMVESD